MAIWNYPYFNFENYYRHAEGSDGTILYNLTKNICDYYSTIIKNKFGQHINIFENSLITFWHDRNNKILQNKVSGMSTDKYVNVCFPPKINWLNQLINSKVLSHELKHLAIWRLYDGRTSIILTHYIDNIGKIINLGGYYVLDLQYALDNRLKILEDYKNGKLPKGENSYN